MAKKTTAGKDRYAIIVAGGVGSRFWPLSRRKRPKQVLALAGSSSMLEETAARVRGLVEDENVLVVTSETLAGGVRKLLPWIPGRNVLAEPVGRNTAAAVGWAALEVARRNENGVMLVLPADHLIEHRKKFLADMSRGLALAFHQRRLVTFGITPSGPATGYGYLKAGKTLEGGLGGRQVAAFYEKPTLARARRYVANKNYYWNSGMFAWRADVVLEEIDKHLPGLGKALARLDGERSRGRVSKAALARIYPRLTAISVDYGIMEHSDKVAMVPASFDWSDVGSWDVAGESWPQDAHGNRSRDDLVSIDSSGNMVYSGGKLVALVGVDDLVVVDSGDALLVCRKDRSQDVREVVTMLEKAGVTRLL
jgi:mannose-1-phosphate guanylyltransferase